MIRFYILDVSLYNTVDPDRFEYYVFVEDFSPSNDCWISMARFKHCIILSGNLVYNFVVFCAVLW